MRHGALGRGRGLWLSLALSIGLGAGAEEVRLPATLTLAQAVELFHRAGFDLLLAEAAVQSARGDELVAGAVPNPGVNGTYGRSFACDNGSCSAIPTPLWGAGLSDNNAIEDSLSGKRGLRLSVARAALAAARSSRADAERNLLFQVKQAFVQLLLAQESVKSSLEAQGAADRLFELTQIRYRAGAISEADVARAQTDKLEADQAVDTARQSLRSAQVGLAFLLGVRSRVPELTARGDELLRYAPLSTAVSSERLVPEALSHRPDVQASRLQRDRAEASTRLARRLVFPDIGLSVSYSQEGLSTSAITPPTVSFGLSATLPLFYQQQGEVTKAEADLRTQSIQVDKAEAQVVSDVEGAVAGFVASERLAKRMEGNLLASARRARDLVQLQYEKGAASLLELLDANRTYRAVALEHLQDVTAYWTSVFRLEQAVGVELK